MAMVTIKGAEIDFRPMTPEVAMALQRICTELGLPRHCPFGACKRAHRCATRQVLCYQALRQEINAIIRPVIREQAAKKTADDDGLPAAVGDRRAGGKAPGHQPAKATGTFRRRSTVKVKTSGRA